MAKVVRLFTLNEGDVFRPVGRINAPSYWVLSITPPTVRVMDLRSGKQLTVNSRALVAQTRRMFAPQVLAGAVGGVVNIKRGLQQDWSRLVRLVEGEPL